MNKDTRDIAIRAEQGLLDLRQRVGRIEGLIYLVLIGITSLVCNAVWDKMFGVASTHTH